MARSHTMTPRRRAALRKAQLASARKRRKRNTVGSSVKRAVRQRASYAKASVQTRRGRRKKKASKGRAKAILIGVGTFGAVTAAMVAKSEFNGSARRIRHETRATARGKYG